jgi:DNA-binding NarL/FixJ family response regulator
MNAQEKISILIADDHDLVRRGLVLILGLFPEFKIVGDVKDGREAVDSALLLHPTVIIMDLNMPNLNGIEATRIIKKMIRPSRYLLSRPIRTTVMFFKSIAAAQTVTC